MAKKVRDNVVVAVLSNLTEDQVGEVSKEIMKIKRRKAPGGRGTIGVGKKSDVGRLIQEDM